MLTRFIMASKRKIERFREAYLSLQKEGMDMGRWKIFVLDQNRSPNQPINSLKSQAVPDL